MAEMREHWAVDDQGIDRLFYRAEDVDRAFAMLHRQLAAKDKRLDRYCNIVAKVAGIVGRGPEPASDVVADALAMAAELDAARAKVAQWCL